MVICQLFSVVCFTSVISEYKKKKKERGERGRVSPHGPQSTECVTVLHSWSSV